MTRDDMAGVAQGWRRPGPWTIVQPKALAAAAVTALVISGCTATREPRISHVGPPGQQTLLVNGQQAGASGEADRLIAALNLSDGMKQVARDFVAIEMARGIPARAAVANWVSMRRRQGVVVRCVRIAADTVECVAR
ncbi:MAG: hypothetical protein IOC56_08810 [Methylobacterium sp.]|nr:hypothetical protein [Methylobacterium sp.]MCA3608379.1 hypothetical protein [Methylobacterium sp.]MCA3617884.1 hypothetical protein [Methylobacterium sp.]MCA3621175.1 hypothetical protein [Methylobacterium sp.]